MNEQPHHYPARLTIDYPDRELDWTATLFRAATIVPIAFLLILLMGLWGHGEECDHRYYDLATGTIVALPLALMILFRQKYPRWWFDWNLEFTRFYVRVSAYFLLLRDEYPSTDEQQAVHLELDYPDAERDLNRWLVLIKWIMACPHFLILWVLLAAAWFAAIGAWFAILFTGRYPRELFDFVVGVLRWKLRVVAYAFLQITDRYPPFSLSE